MQTLSDAKASRDALVRDAMPMVDLLLRRLQRKSKLPVDYEDLRQIGYVALIDAANRYDSQLQVPFEVWAHHRVLGAMIDGIGSLTGVTRSQIRALNEYAKAEDGRKVPSMVQVIRGDSLEPIFNESSFTERPKDPEAQAQDNQFLRQLTASIGQLETEEREIILFHYQSEMNLSEIAKQRGLSRSWISRLHSKVIERLRALMAEGAMTRSLAILTMISVILD